MNKKINRNSIYLGCCISGILFLVGNIVNPKIALMYKAAVVKAPHMIGIMLEFSFSELVFIDLLIGFAMIYKDTFFSKRTSTILNYISLVFFFIFLIIWVDIAMMAIFDPKGLMTVE